MDKPIEYEQTDPRWAKIMYSAIGNKAQTIGTSGCGPSSAAMAIATLCDDAVTPKEAAAFAISGKHRTANDGTTWSYFPAILKKYNIPCEQTGSADKIIAALKKGYMVITTMGRGLWTTGGHVLLAYGISADGSKVLINDPNSEAVYREMGDISKFRAQLAQGWIIAEDWRSKMIVQKKTVEVFNEAGKASQLNGVYGDKTNYIAIREIAKIVPWAIEYDAAQNRVIVKPNIK